MSDNLYDSASVEVPPTLAPLSHNETPPPDLPRPGSEPQTLPVAPGAAILSAPPVKGYEILGELGRGGMGIVYRARQVALNRLVALKMIVTGEFAHGEEITRFRHEAEAVAQLEHPNIIRIYDIGDHGGRPCFAMELADAGSLADRLDGKPLPPPEAARLLETLARAMHHAHQRNIVHRDLKPGNILLSVTGSGTLPAETDGPLPLSALQPKITDFGLAKRMDSKGRTETGRVLGTVNYMAPEQAEGRSRDVGPHSDVYGLGAILYELLTGHPPFQAESIVATLEMVRTQEPRPVREVNPSCPRDLETICLKCLEKDPERRYGSAQDLADDLARFLAGEPIRARPVSTWERVWRVVRRRRREAAWVAGSVAALAVLGVLLVQQAMQKEDEKRQAREEYDGAVAAIEQTRQLISAPRGPDDGLADLLADLPRRYQQVQQRVEDVDRLERAPRACDDLGLALRNSGRSDQASDACKTAVLLYSTLIERRPDCNGYREDRAKVRLRQGQIRADFRDYDAAEHEYRQALEELDALAAREPGNRGIRRHRAEAFHLLGILFDSRKQRRQAVDAYLEGLKIRDALVAEEPGNREFRRDLARSHGYLGDTYLELGEVDRSWKAYEVAERIRRILSEEKPDDADARFQLARSRANEGYFAMWKGDAPRAISAFEDAYEMQDRLADEYPGVAEYRGDLGWTLLSLAELKLDRDGPTDGVAGLLARAQSIFSDLRNAGSDANHARNLARVYVDLGQFFLTADPARARDELHSAREILEELTLCEGEQPRDDPEDLYHLARLESLEGALLGSSAGTRTAEVEKQRWEYANRAMDRLVLAIHGGYAKPSRLQRGVAGLDLLWETDARRMEALVEKCRPTSRVQP